MNKLHHHLSSTYSRFVTAFKVQILAALIFLVNPSINAQNNCLNFDGSNDHVNLGTLAPTGNFTTGFTYMGWVKWGAFNNWSRLFDFGTGEGVNNILLACNATSNSLTLSNYLNTTPYQLTSGNIAQLNQWIHIAVTISNTGTAKIYVNGLVVASGNIQPPANIARNLCYLGRSNWAADAYFNGRMDEVSIWTHELTSTEINNSMFNPLVGNESGLYIYYKFDLGTAGGTNTSITTLNDITSNAKHGTLTGFTLSGVSSNFVESTVPSTIQNNCLSFDGSNDYVALPALGSNLSQFTIETWFNANSFPSAGNLTSIFNTNTWAAGDIHYQFVNTGGTPQIQLAVNNSTIVNINYSFSTNTWYHLAATYNATTKIIKLFVNGSLVLSVPIATAANANFTASQIGAWTTQRYFAGRFDDYRIWSTERTASEISTNMFSSLTGNETGLLVCYKFNQGVAGGTNTNLTTAINATGTNHGTLINFALTGSSSNWVSGIKDAPTNHVTGFAGSLVSNKMTLTWTDVSSAPEPDGYYIYASTENSFSNPINGNEPAVDNDLSDGTGVIKVLNSIQTYNGWVNESIGTIYYFRIYPFTNSGSYIKFNTTSPIPEAQLTSKPLFSYGSATLSVLANKHTWGDFNNDGYLDFLINIGGEKWVGSTWDGDYSYLYVNNKNNTFTKHSSFNYPSHESYLKWLDFDNDNDLDVIASERIYFNNGGSFTRSDASTFGLNTFRGTWIDFDNDGDLDFITNNCDNNAVKLYRKTNNYFYEVYSTNFQPFIGDIAAIDYNCDGFKDIITTGVNSVTNKSENRLYKNDGNGKFTLQKTTSGRVYSGFGDYNADGLIDILAYSYPDDEKILYVELLTNIDGENFISQIIDSTTFSINSELIFTIADLDNDGWADLMYTLPSNVDQCELKVMKNNQNGKFTNIHSHSFSKDYSISITDINKNGKIDYVISNYDSHYTFFNISTITNNAPDKITNATATLKGNGVVLNWHATDDKTPQNGLTYNLRIGTLSGASNILAPNSTNTGQRKLLEPGNMGADTSVFFNLLPGTYYWNVQAVDNSYQGGAFMDADKTFTIVDVQASNLEATIVDKTSLNLRWSNGNGTRRVVFAKIGTSGTAAPANSTSYIASSEFGSGDQIGTTGWFCVFNSTTNNVTISNLSADYSYIFQVFEYRGNAGSETYITKSGQGNPGTFSTAVFSLQPPIGNAYEFTVNSQIKMGDFNNDNYLDFLFYNSHTSSMLLYLNQSDNTFTKDSIPLVSKLNYASFHVFDYNSDGLLDFIYTGSFYESWNREFSRAYIYTNNGDNTFTGVLSDSILGTQTSSITCGDFNNDGNIDLFVGGLKSNIIPDPFYGSITEFNPISYLYKNLGSSENYKFSTVNSQFKALKDGGSCFGDFNNDGWDDLIISGNTPDDYSYIYLYLNNQDGTFDEQELLVSQGQNYSKMVCADYNKDGYLDFICGAIYFINKGDATFELNYNSFSIQNSNNGFTISDFNNDGTIDILFNSSKYPHFKKLYLNNYPENNFSIQSDFNSEDGIGISSGDYDNDGDADFTLAASSSSDKINIFRNTLIMKSGVYNQNQKPEKPQNVQFNQSPNKLTITWDAVITDESPYLSYNVSLKKDTILFNSPNSDYLTGKRQVPEIGNSGLNTFALFKNLEPGTYEVKVQAVDGAYCGGEWSTPTTVDVKDLQTFYSFDEVCRGAETQFTDQSSPQDKITWLWRFDDGTTSTEQNPKHKFVASGAHQVWLIITSTELTDANGSFLKDSVMHTVNVKPNPKAAFTAPNACQGTETKFTNNTNMDGAEAKSWKWDYGNSDLSTDSIPLNKIYGIAKTYNTKLVVVATNNCADSIQVNTTVVPVPSAVISVTQNSKFSFCKDSDDSAILSLATQDNCNYQWENYSVVLTDKTNNQLAITGSDNVGIYSITATVTSKLVSEGCVARSTNPVVITINPKASKPIIEEKTNNTLFCPGTEVELNVKNYSNTVNYQWKYYGVVIDGANNQVYKGKLAAGDYSVEAEPGSCATESDKITLKHKLALSKPTILGHGPTVWILACNNMTATNYRWYYNNDLIPGANKYQYVANKNYGDYYVTVNDGGECWTPSDVFKVDLTNGIDDLANENVRVFPNPSEGVFNVSLGLDVSGEVNVRIVDVLGKVVLSQIYNTGDFPVDISQVTNGIYYISIMYKNEVIIKKVVKQ